MGFVYVSLDRKRIVDLREFLSAPSRGGGVKTPQRKRLPKRRAAGQV